MKDAAGPPSNNYFQTYLYGIEYRGSSIESVSHQEGRLFRTSGSSSNPVWRYEYSISDHLGNTRLTFADKTPDGIIKIEDGEVLEEAHYYPFGLAMEGPWINDAAALDTRYKFNGIERVQDFGLNMDLAMYRSYDPAIGRWWQADPIVKPWENPYAAMYNNPMNWSDFLGADPEEDGDSDSSDQGRRPRKPKKGKDLPEVVVTAKRVENNSPATNLQIHSEGVYFQKGESWYKVTEAPLAEGGGQLYGYDARAGWVRVSSSYQDYKSQLEAATTLADGMTTAVAIVEGFFGAGVMFNAGLLAPAKAGLRTVPATGRGAQASRLARVPKTGTTALRPVGSLLESVDDVMANPNLLQGQSYGYVRNMLGKSKGWMNSFMRKTRGTDKGWVLRQVNSRGQETGKLIEYHPGTHRHFGGKPYWKVSDGTRTTRFPAAN